MTNTKIIKKIGELEPALKSKEILQYLNKRQVSKSELLKLVLESKTGFDQAILDEEIKGFFNGFEESSIYSANYSDLLLVICYMGDTDRPDVDNAFVNTFLLFHKILHNTTSVINMLLDTSDTKEAVETGKVLKIPAEDDLNHIIAENDRSVNRFLKSFAAIG